MYRNLALGIGAYVVIAGITVAFMLLSGMIAARTDPDDPKIVAQGELLYAAHCARCHGKNLEGQPNWETKKPDGTYPAPPQNETGHTWEHSDRELFDYIRWGGGYRAPKAFKSAMPSFGKRLTTNEIWAILTYVKSRWPEATRKTQSATNFLGGIHTHY